MRYLACWVFVLAILIPAEVEAADHYMSVSGTDAGTCTMDAPCKTFKYATNSTRLTAGDTLWLNDGTYGAGSYSSSAVYGDAIMYINCSGPSTDGTSGAHITVRAVNERQATVDANGVGDLETIHMVNCD